LPRYNDITDISAPLQIYADSEDFGLPNRYICTVAVTATYLNGIDEIIKISAPVTEFAEGATKLIYLSGLYTLKLV
jgi:hypothetical protein